MEQSANLENNQEKIEKVKLIEALQVNGSEHPETKALMIKWIKQRETEVEKENTSRATIVFNIDRADLYIAANDMEGALEHLEDTLMQTRQEGEKELGDQIRRKIKELKV